MLSADRTARHLTPERRPAEMDTLVTAIPNGVPGAGGVVALLVGLFWMLATDRLVTGPSHRRQMEDKDRQIQVLRESNERLEKSLNESLGYGTTMLDMLHSIRSAAQEGADRS